MIKQNLVKYVNKGQKKQVPFKQNFPIDECKNAKRTINGRGPQG
jgi:hypothetical protein